MEVAKTKKKAAAKAVSEAVAAKVEAPAKPEPRMNFDDAFSTDLGSAPTPKKSKSSKEMTPVPAELKTELHLAVSGKRIMKVVEDKMNLALLRLKKFSVRRWARSFVRTGSVPSSAQLSDGAASIDFIPTKRIYIKTEKVQALKLLGVNIDPYLEIDGVDIDFEALARHNLMDDFKRAITSLPNMTPAILNDIMKKRVVAKESLYPDMARMARESLPNDASEDEVVDRMVTITEIIQPVSSLRNPQDDQSLGDAIDFVGATNLEPTAEEEASIKSKKFGGNDE